MNDRMKADPSLPETTRKQTREMGRNLDRWEGKRDWGTEEGGARVGEAQQAPSTEGLR